MMYVDLVHKKSWRKICIHAQRSDKALGGAVLWYQMCTHTFPGASLSLLLELQTLPRGTLRTTGRRHHCWARKLQHHPSSHRKKAGNGWPQASWQGISKSTATLCLLLMAPRHFPHHTKLFNKWAVQSTMSTKLTHTGKQFSGWTSWSQGPSVSIKITEHEISYWSHATDCTSKEAQEGKWVFPKSILNWLPKLSPDPFQTAEWK